MRYANWVVVYGLLHSVELRFQDASLLASAHLSFYLIRALVDGVNTAYGRCF